MPDPHTIFGLAQILIGGSLLLGILVFIHESGHYFVAKALGIRVEVFSLGFGPRIAGFEKGGTDYRISALPLGGYVKMLGENPEESLQGSAEEFLSRSKFDRFLVLVMGASLNLVLAVALTAGIYMYGDTAPLYLTQSPVIGGLDPNAAAAEAGLRVSDEILAVDSHEVKTWHDLQLQIALNPNKQVSLVVRRDGARLTVPVKVRATERDQMGIIGIMPQTRYAVAQVVPGGPADKAGVRPGDELIKVDGQEITLKDGVETLFRLVSSSPGRALTFTVERGGKQMDLAVTPQEKAGKGDPGIFLGLPEGVLQYGPREALVKSVEDNWEQAGLVFLILKKLVVREMSPRTLSGPIEIFRMAGASLNAGLRIFLKMMAFMSLQLGVMNLLPIPVLDGGHIFILLVEGIMRRDLSMKIKERVMQFGLILLLLIMGGVISLDVYKNFFIQ